MNGLGTEKIEQIRKRQTARLLDHLEKKGKLTQDLRADILRSLGYVFEDVLDALNTQQGDGTDEQRKAIL